MISSPHSKISPGGAAPAQKHERPQKFFRGCNVDIFLILFSLPTMQCKWTLAKRFAHSTEQTKCSMLRKQSQKCSSLAPGSNRQVHYDNSHKKRCYHGVRSAAVCRLPRCSLRSTATSVPMMWGSVAEPESYGIGGFWVDSESDS